MTVLDDVPECAVLPIRGSSVEVALTQHIDGDAPVTHSGVVVDGRPNPSGTCVRLT